jgi:hypothetical protein
VDDGRRGDDFRAQPARVSLARSRPLAAVKLAREHARLLFARAADDEEERIEAPRAEGRRDPAASEGEVARVEPQAIVFEKRGEGHSARR